MSHRFDDDLPFRSKMIRFRGETDTREDNQYINSRYVQNQDVQPSTISEL